MVRYIVFLSTIAAPLLMAGALPSTAAKSPAMESCSAEWAKMKEAKTIPEGQTWPKFWGQCSKDYAAAHGSDTGEETTTSTKKTKKATKTAAVNEDESTGSSAADKKDCDGKWHDYKTGSGAHGWKAYFTFMAKCMP